MASSDSGILEELLVLTEQPDTLPRPSSPQQMEAPDQPPTESTELMESMVITGTEVMEEKVEEIPMDDRARKRMTMKILSIQPDGNPLNYVAALRIRQDRGRRSSRDLFEQLS